MESNPGAMPGVSFFGVTYWSAPSEQDHMLVVAETFEEAAAAFEQEHPGKRRISTERCMPYMDALAFANRYASKAEDHGA